MNGTAERGKILSGRTGLLSKCTLKWQINHTKWGNYYCASASFQWPPIFNYFSNLKRKTGDWRELLFFAEYYFNLCMPNTSISFYGYDLYSQRYFPIYNYYAECLAVTWSRDKQLLRGVHANTHAANWTAIRMQPWLYGNEFSGFSANFTKHLTLTSNRNQG